MELTKFTHACVRVERGGAVLVIDPGTFSELEALEGADAVLITHEHFDHLDPDKLAEALARRPEMTVYAHPDVVPKLGVPDRAVHPVSPGDRFRAAGFDVQVYGGQHAVIHPDRPRITNQGYLIEETVFHPGDALEAPGVPVDTLLVPVCAPWLKIAEVVEFVRAVAPNQAHGIHDHLLSKAGGQVFDQLLGDLVGCDYTRLPAGASVAARP